MKSIYIKRQQQARMQKLMYVLCIFSFDEVPKLQSETIPRVVVDIREFNSELPAVLWSHGIDIVPMPIEVRHFFFFH